jgi:hypothetical protein
VEDIDPASKRVTLEATKRYFLHTLRNEHIENIISFLTPIAVMRSGEGCLQVVARNSDSSIAAFCTFVRVMLTGSVPSNALAIRVTI